MTFDQELEDLEVQAYQVVKSLPAGTLRRQDSWRSSTGGDSAGEQANAVNAVIDFKEHRRSSALRWARGFAARFATEIKRQVCSNSGTDLGKVAEITASAIAAWIVASFGVTNPIAFAMSTLVVLVLARALRAAFCEMTDDEIKGTIQTSS